MDSNTLAVRVGRIKDEAIDIKSFELISVGGTPLPSFDSGAHIDVHVEPGITRQYSLCNEPGRSDSYLIAVKKEPASRGGSRAMHENIKEGDVLVISKPRNNFSLEANAKRHVLIAAGIGITPMLSMAWHLTKTGGGFQLHYFSRSVSHTAFYDALLTPEFGGKIAFYHALAPEEVRACLEKVLSSRPDGAHVYMCGPGPFMDQVKTVAAAAWTPEAIHLEYFAADLAALSAPKDEFEVVLARSGGSYKIPRGESIVDVLARQGICIKMSCEQGVCGTCLTGVVSGTPDHRDVFLSNEEKRACDKMTPCVSRSKSPRLVLDL